jgi:crotonobetainyl-CoA:carnitine CoA-transferase CaiB-like acyl-CoA transferase
MTTAQLSTAPASLKALKPLKGIRILSLALNLPGPAALMRCREMGATCVKLEPPGGDPMMAYNPDAFAAMHQGMRVTPADLKTDTGQKVLHRELARADVLLTSFRPSALAKLGLGWKALHSSYPGLSQVAIVGSPGALADTPGHDLTYLAEMGLVTGLDLPATLYADMGGSLMTVQAVLQAVLHKAGHGKGVYQEVALASAAAYLALPRTWGLTKPGAPVGGGHAGYRVYACKDGRVAVAALEPHFAVRLCAAVGIEPSGPKTMLAPATQRTIAAWLLGKTRKQLDLLALEKDIPLHTLPVS